MYLKFIILGTNEFCTINSIYSPSVHGNFSCSFSPAVLMRYNVNPFCFVVENIHPKKHSNEWALALGVFKILLASVSWVSLCDLEAGKKKGFDSPLFDLFGEAE